jgi:endonuclease YncB( thermonuclease family)
VAWDFVARPELWNGLPMDIYYFDSPHKQITEDFEGVVSKVHDGDTFTIDTKFRNFGTKVRMVGIDSLELNVGGGKARDWLKSKIEGKRVDIILDEERVGKWGRILGTVIANGMNINDLAIIEGMAVPFDRRNELANRSSENAFT